MKRIVLLSMMFFAYCLPIYSQYASTDFTIITKGLSKEYSEKFLAKKADLVKLFDEIGITSDIKPIVINVEFENGNGFVNAVANFDYDMIFNTRSDYWSHNTSMKSYLGKGHSVFLENQIFMALGGYLRSVSDYDSDILKFESVVSLKKKNGDIVHFSAHNFFTSDGFYHHRFYKEIIIKMAGKTYTAEVSTQMCDENNYFLIGKTTGLDGKKTAMYYLDRFFQPN